VRHVASVCREARDQKDSRAAAGTEPMKKMAPPPRLIALLFLRSSCWIERLDHNVARVPA